MRIIIGFIILGAMLYFSLSVCSVGKETDRVMEEYIRKMDEEEQRVEANITKEEKVCLFVTSFVTRTINSFDTENS